MKLKKSFSLFFLFAMATEVSLNAQSVELVRFEELSALQQKEERPVLVFLTADWCTYCKRVEQTSFTQKEIVETLNTKFYYVNFNIEQREPIVLGEQIFRFKSSGINTGVHELAEAIGTIDGVLNTPTFIVLNSRFEIMYQYGGFLDSKQIEKLLKEAE